MKYVIDNRTRYNTDDLHEIVERVWGAWGMRWEGIEYHFSRPWDFAGCLIVKPYNPTPVVRKDYREREKHDLVVKLCRNGDGGKKELTKHLGLVPPKRAFANVGLEELAACAERRVPDWVIKQIVCRLHNLRKQATYYHSAEMCYPQLYSWVHQWMVLNGKGLQLRYQGRPRNAEELAQSSRLAKAAAELAQARKDHDYFARKRREWERKLAEAEHKVKQCDESIERVQARINKCEKRLKEAQR